MQTKPNPDINCKCKKEQLHLCICVICDCSEMKQLSNIDRQKECPIHEIVMFCGKPEFVCTSCVNAGWYSTAGCGGCTRHINEKTGEIRDCTCEEERSKNYTCVICNVSQNRPMTKNDRKKDCKIHKFIMCCGQYEFVCQSCVDEGWYSTAGFGGPTQHINEKTGEKRQVKRNNAPGIIF